MSDKPKTDRRRLVGNEMIAGGKPRRPATKGIGPSIAANYEIAQVKREQLIKLAADPPRLPIPAPADKLVPDTPLFNQIAYNVLLIAVLAAIAIATNYINWAFLAYGLLAIAARLPSSQIFVAGLISLILIPVTTSLQRETLSNDFAVMTFYFLAIGLLRAMLELRRDNKKK